MSIRTVRFILALLALIVAGSVIAGLLFVAAPASNREALFLALGVVLNLPAMAFGFYFGSAEKQGVEITNPPEHPVPTEDVQS